MSHLTIWHHRRCSKSRATLALLHERGLQPEVILYTETPPSTDDVRQVLDMLALSPRQLMRPNETIYKELGLANITDDEALLEAMACHPILIQRPIVISGGKAAIGRPPENVLDILHLEA